MSSTSSKSHTANKLTVTGIRMKGRTQAHSLAVATDLFDFIETEALPGTSLTSKEFWKGFSDLVLELAPKNMALLAERDRLQAELDQWHRANPGPIQNQPQYQSFLKRIGYLVEPPAKVQATTTNVDDELAK